VRTVFAAHVHNTGKALFRNGDPAVKGKPAPTALGRQAGGWFGGAREAPDLPLDSDVLREEELRHYVAAGSGRAAAELTCRRIAGPGPHPPKGSTAHRCSGASEKPMWCSGTAERRGAPRTLTHDTALLSGEARPLAPVAVTASRHLSNISVTVWTLGPSNAPRHPPSCHSWLHLAHLL